MDENTKQILEIITDIQERMATKEDIQLMRSEMEEMRSELQEQIMENTKAIAELAEQIRNVLGHAKELDILMARVSAIEKHVGIR